MYPLKFELIKEYKADLLGEKVTPQHQLKILTCWI